MKTNGGGWRRALELVAGTFVGLWLLVIVMEVASGAPSYEIGQRTGQLAVWLLVFLVARQSRIKKQKSDSASAYAGSGQAGQAPAGWYSDPAGDGHRYWDGAAWTQHRS